MEIILSTEELALAKKMGTALKTARIKSHQTQDDFGARIGVSRWTLAEMENGNVKVSLSSWIKASNLLGLLGTWGNVFIPEKDPFAEFDETQLKLNRQPKRVRKRKNDANSR